MFEFKFVEGAIVMGPFLDSYSCVCACTNSHAYILHAQTQCIQLHTQVADSVPPYVYGGRGVASSIGTVEDTDVTGEVRDMARAAVVAARGQ